MTDALKDELESSIPLTRIEAAVSVRREQLRQDLILANRELLEWHLAEKVGIDPTKPVSLHSKERVFGRTVLKADQEYRLWFFWRAGLIFVVALFAIDMNSTSLHGFYRTQIARNWIEPLDGVGRELPLAQLDTTAHGAPYHLISTSLNLMGRRRKDPGDMQASYFLFSKLFCGSAAVAYAPTARFAGGKYKLADAVAISGAAVSPAQNAGLLVRALLFMGNMRLGQWLPNPAYQSSLPYWLQRLSFPFWVTPARLLSQSVRLAETRPHVFVSDGGHHENLGVGPLLERRCRLILAFDAGADEEFQFADLANLVRWAKLKHGVQIQPLSNELLHELVPSQPLDPEIGSATGADLSSDPMSSVKKSSVGNRLRLSKNHWIAAQIIYPPEHLPPGEAPSATDDARFGLLIYVKTTLTGQEPFEVLRYARSNQNFPHDSTADQLYDPDQFATYVQLGQCIAQEIQDVVSQQPDRLWKQCGDSPEFQQNISTFLKSIS